MIGTETNEPWTVTVLTLFEEMFPGSLGYSLAGQGLKDGIWTLETLDIRGFASDKHRSVDDTPFGGGPGMVLRADVVDEAIEKIKVKNPDKPLIYFSPRGRPLEQKRVRELAAGPGLSMLCGRYEGIDERLQEVHKIQEVSLGDFVLSGGEPAAIALIDACVRLLPGIMGSVASGVEESFEQGLLEYPHYTRPQVWRGIEVPKVLLSGNHEKIKDWRKSQSEEVTKERRPDLWSHYVTKF
jgi:tRNA (guanine37-N1)-methyltransferase